MSDFISRPLDLLLGYVPGMVLPRVKRAEDKQWHPEDATNHERKAFAFARATNLRSSTEDRWTAWHRSKLIKDRWRLLTDRCQNNIDHIKAVEQTRIVVQELIHNGTIDVSDLPDADKLRAEDALSVLVEITRDGNARRVDQISAAKAILDFTRAKPAAKTEVKVSNGLSWLDDLVETDPNSSATD